MICMPTFARPCDTLCAHVQLSAGSTAASFPACQWCWWHSLQHHHISILPATIHLSTFAPKHCLCVCAGLYNAQLYYQTWHSLQDNYSSTRPSPIYLLLRTASAFLQACTTLSWTHSKTSRPWLWSWTWLSHPHSPGSSRCCMSNAWRWCTDWQSRATAGRPCLAC